MNAVPSHDADSAGQTWQGRALSDSGFGTDDGSADPAVLEALRHPEQETDMLRVLAGARFLVPIVAAPTEVVQHGALTADKAADMAVATLVAPDGTRALPVFTSQAALAAWDPAARPSPVTADRAAQAAVAEGCSVMVVDLAAEHCVALRPSHVWALAMGRPWQPAHTDPHVAQAVSAAADDEPAVVSAACEAGEGGALRIVLSLRPGLDSTGIDHLVQRIGERLASDGETRARIDAISFAIRGNEA